MHVSFQLRMLNLVVGNGPHLTKTYRYRWPKTEHARRQAPYGYIHNNLKASKYIVSTNEIVIVCLMSTYTVETIDRVVCKAGFGQALPCQQERGNAHDPYAVAVLHASIQAYQFCLALALSFCWWQQYWKMAQR